jgi:hypothetical protein
MQPYKRVSAPNRGNGPGAQGEIIESIQARKRNSDIRVLAALTLMFRALNVS